MKKALFSSLLTALCMSASAQFFAPNGTVSATTNPATNNVGIGKSTPSTRLDVNGTFQVYPSGNAGTSGALKLMVVPGPSSTMIQANSDLSWANHDIVFNAANTAGNNTDQLVLYRNGNVGIGVNSPGEKLVVNGNIKLGNVSGKIFWDWTDRAIEQYSPDGNSQMIRFRNSMSATYGNPLGGFDFADNLGNSVLRILDGKVGIGATSLDAALTVNGNVRTTRIVLTQDASIDGINVGTKQVQFLSANGGNNRIQSFGGSNGFGTWLFKSRFDHIELDAGEIAGTPRKIIFKVGGVTKMNLNEYGNLMVGPFQEPFWSDPAKYRLNVDGVMRANEIFVNTDGADFVFQDDYRLKKLSEVESFIKQHKHLPDVPSAETMQQQGMGVGDLQTKLLQKVEELTLYVIELKKEIDSLKKANEGGNH